VYQTKEFKFSKGYYSLVLIAVFPLSVCAAIFSGYCCKRWDPFRVWLVSLLIDYVLTTWFILGIFYFWPITGGDQHDSGHVDLWCVTYACLTLNRYFGGTAWFAIITRIADRRVGGFYLTI